ncbi:hypothetical protein DV736_g1676, partial [Chaetothyriales sp. CBS 134916]
MAVPAVHSTDGQIEAGKQACIQDKYDKAQRSFASAIKTSKCTNPTCLKLLDHQTGALLKLKRFDESLNCAKSMIRHSRTDGRGYIRCGKLERLQGNYEAALKWYQHGLKNVPPKDPLHATLKAKIESIQAAIRQERYRTKLRDPLVSLPLEVAQLIASYLDFQTLVMVMRVSRSWKAFVASLPITSDTLDFSGARQQVQVKAYRAALRRLKTTPRKVVVFNFSRPASTSVAQSLGVWLKAGSLDHLEVFDLHCMHQLNSTTKLFTLVGQVDTNSISPNLKSVVFGPEARLELHGMIALLTQCTKLVHARFGSVAADDPPLPPLSTIFPHLEEELHTLPPTIDPFTVTTKNGYLPCNTPLVKLPDDFSALSKILDNMPVEKLDGKPGLLANFALGPLIDDGQLPDLTPYLDRLIRTNGRLDLPLVTALFRDYSFLASSYLLEPCWESWSKDRNQGYGLGRQRLPKCIAGPLVETAKILDIPPFMSYAASYALYNYYLEDPSLDTSVYSNLRLVRAFEHGLNPKSSEAGFILTHIHMVQSTGPLIEGAVSLLKSIDGHPNPTAEDLSVTTSAFQTMLTAMTRIEASMETMWTNSLPKDYISYRTFIFGITNQSMFPNGVIYEGENDDKPMYFRGESGANDSIIPLLDHILEVPMPKNPLTDILIDFRKYRPRAHREFLGYMMSKAGELGVRKYCMANTDLAQLYLKLLDHVRSFRWRHWLFAREYIIKRSSHPTATGGSPIVTWLPNQLMAVMDAMDQVYKDSGLESMVQEEEKGMAFVKGVMDKMREQRDKLDKEVKKYCEERGV